MDPALSEAARDLGANPMRVLKDITLPLVFPAVLSGMMLSAAMSLDDVVISFFVTSAETTTLRSRSTLACVRAARRKSTPFPR